MSVPDNHTSEVLAMTGSIDTALVFHLTARVFPSRMVMFDTAKRAITQARRGDWGARVRLPEGVQHARYGRVAPVREVFEHLNLWCFVQDDGED